MSNTPEKPQKITGIRHVYAAAIYSLYGIKRLFMETAFRHQLVAMTILFSSFVLSGVPLYGYVIAIILILIVFACEALNTAIEEIVDHVSPEWSQAGKNAKDLGSCAVLCALIATAVFWAYAVVTACCS